MLTVNKKVVVMSVVALAALSLIGAGVYQYMSSKNTAMQDISQPNSSEQKEDTMPSIELEGNFQGGLSICSDKCGDGICQKTDVKCEGGNLNCICTEDAKECPQDCK